MRVAQLEGQVNLLRRKLADLQKSMDRLQQVLRAPRCSTKPQRARRGPAYRHTSSICFSHVPNLPPLSPVGVQQAGHPVPRRGVHAVWLPHRHGRRPVGTVRAAREQTGGDGAGAGDALLAGEQCSASVRQRRVCSQQCSAPTPAPTSDVLLSERPAHAAPSPARPARREFTVQNAKQNRRRQLYRQPRPHFRPSLLLPPPAPPPPTPACPPQGVQGAVFAAAAAWRGGAAALPHAARQQDGAGAHRTQVRGPTALVPVPRSRRCQQAGEQGLR